MADHLMRLRGSASPDNRNSPLLAAIARKPAGMSGSYRRMPLMAGCAAAAFAAVSAQAADTTAAGASATTAAQPADATTAPTSSTAPAAHSTEEITVTATRRNEDISKVPINVTAYSQGQMDDLSIRQIDDIARLTPDIQFSRTAGSNGNNSDNISIRGLASDVGAATTAIYIDDTPIQIRNIGYWAGNPYPKIFDLERVEVLRGPQGTLFGAGAEGGAVRFITPQPSLTDYSGYFKTELSDTINGDPSYETGAAVGGPIVPDKLGFRISAWGRRDGGYIDRVSPDTGAIVDANSNYQQSGAVKAAFAWKPIDRLTLTPSIYYQDVYSNDRDQYWPSLSHASSDEFSQAARIKQPSDDRFSLPSLRIQYDFDQFSVISNTSLFNRKQSAEIDYSNYLASLLYGNPYQYASNDVPSPAYLTTNQHNLTQEIRAQSTTPDAFVDWTVGSFYSWDKQQEQQTYIDGQHDIAELLGAPTLPGKVGERLSLNAYDEQISGFGNVDVNVTDMLKLTAGVRVSRQNFSYNELGEGPVNGGTTYNYGSEHELSATPKFGVSLQVDPQNFLYATASEGFRPGGAQSPAPAAFCAADLGTLGLTQSPQTYRSDSAWSYELGAKDNFFGGRLRLDSSVYLIRWKNIEQSVYLPNCGFNYVVNLGSATSVGGDFSARFAVTPDFSVGINSGYSSVTVDQTNLGGGGTILAEKGDRIGGPPLNATLWAQYSFQVWGDRDAFARADYTFNSHSPSIDSRVFAYDSEIPSTKATNYVSIRGGVSFGKWELSAFVNNLTNQEEPLTVAHDVAGSPLFYESSNRPTTIGTSLEYRF